MEHVSQKRGVQIGPSGVGEPGTRAFHLDEATAKGDFLLLLFIYFWENACCILMLHQGEALITYSIGAFKMK